MSERPGHAAGAGPLGGPDCQPGVDAKAFKAFTGRGRAGEGEFRRLARRLRRVHAAMDELARLSRTVPGRSFYLAVHRRAANRQHALRWRSVAGNRHLPWDSMPALFAVQLPAIAAWYATVQLRVEDLNREECLVREALRHARRRT